jgi:YD repeat-containing protein
MKSKGSFIRRLALVSAIAGAAYADPAPQPQVSFTQGSGTTWNADWTGVTGRTYFAQGSVDLVNWVILPMLEFGTGLKGAGIDTDGADKYFYRLKYIDADWVTTEQEARDADYDGDGIPNWFEVEEIFSDPLDKNSAGGDSNSNGLPDGWELYYFGALGVANSSAILQPDGLTNKEKAELGLNPNADYSAVNATQPTTYSYDLAGRLTGVTAPVAAVTYTVDPEGSILTAQ